MKYLNIDTNQYPIYVGDLQNIGIDINNVPNNFVVVDDTDIPELTSNQTVVEMFPVNVDGYWKQNWLIKDLSEKELQTIKINDARSKLIGGIKLTNEEELLVQPWL